MAGNLHATSEGTVEIFVDDSNIHFWGINQVLQFKEPEIFKDIRKRFAFRVHQTRLVDKILQGRRLRYGCAVAVALPSDATPDKYLYGFSNIGFEVIQGNRTGYDSGKETNVDSTIQKKMLNAISTRKPGVMVLVSWDGNGYMEKKGFIPVLEKALSAGWKIEVVSWISNTNRYLMNFALTKWRFINLETAYYNITFIRNYRLVGEYIAKV